MPDLLDLIWTVCDRGVIEYNVLGQADQAEKAHGRPFTGRRPTYALCDGDSNQEMQRNWHVPHNALGKMTA